jgi:hypothetical protein
LHSGIWEKIWHLNRALEKGLTPPLLVQASLLEGKKFRVCLVEKNWVKSYCSTFRCYLVKFVQPWIN